MAIEPIARGHYTQMQMQDKQLQLARERLAQEQSQLNQRLAADRAARNQQVQHAIGMAFLNTGLDAAKTASTLGIKGAFEDQYAGYTPGALYNAIYSKYGGYVEPKKKEDRKPTGGGEKPAQAPASPTVVDPNDMTREQMDARIAELGGRDLLQRNAMPGLLPVAARPQDVDDRQDRMGIEPGGRRYEGIADRRGRLSPEKDFTAPKPVKPLVRPSGYVGLTPTSLSAPVTKEPVTATTPEAAIAQAAAKAVAEKVEQPTAASQVSGQTAYRRPGTSQVQVDPKTAAATKKLIGVDPRGYSKPSIPLKGDRAALDKDIKAGRRLAYSMIAEKAREEAELAFPRIRDLSKSELDDLSSDERRAYFNAKAARAMLVADLAKTKTAEIEAASRYAKSELPTESQIFQSSKNAAQAVKYHTPSDRASTGRAIAKVLRSGRFVRVGDVQTEISQKTDQQTKDALLNLLPARDKMYVDLGGNANIDVDMDQNEVQFLLAMARKYYAGKYDALLSIAKGNKFQVAGDSVLKDIYFVSPKLGSAGSQGEQENIWGKGVLESIAGGGVGAYIPDDEKRMPGSRAAQAKAQNYAKALIPLLKTWRTGRDGKRRLTADERSELASQIYGIGLNLRDTLVDFSLTKPLTPMKTQAADIKAAATAEKKAEQAAKEAKKQAEKEAKQAKSDAKSLESLRRSSGAEKRAELNLIESRKKELNTRKSVLANEAISELGLGIRASSLKYNKGEALKFIRTGKGLDSKKDPVTYGKLEDARKSYVNKTDPRNNSYDSELRRIQDRINGSNKRVQELNDFIQGKTKKYPLDTRGQIQSGDAQQVKSKEAALAGLSPSLRFVYDRIDAMPISASEKRRQWNEYLDRLQRGPVSSTQRMYT